MDNITLVKDAIHRPDEPRHFMEFQYPDTRYRALLGDTVLADSTHVLKLSEVAMHIYDPVIYFPLADTDLTLLAVSDKSTHCPLKGDTHYYDYTGPPAPRTAVGWCYARAFDFAAALRDYLAFDPRQVDVVRA